MDAAPTDAQIKEFLDHVDELPVLRAIGNMALHVNTMYRENARLQEQLEEAQALIDAHRMAENAAAVRRAKEITQESRTQRERRGTVSRYYR